MAFETEKGNLVTADSVVSSLASPAFVENSQVLQHCLGPCFQEATTNDTVQFVIDGNLVAEVVAEAAAYTPSANTEITQSGVNVTVQKHVALWKPTVEQQRWTRTTPGAHQNIAAEQGRALSVSLNSSFQALFDDFDNIHTTTASGVLTFDDLHDARYAYESTVLGAKSGMCHAVLDRKAVNELRKELAGSAASIFNIPQNQSIFSQDIEVRDRSFVGSYGSIDVFETSGLPTVTAGPSTVDVGLIFDPMLAFALVVDSEGIQTASKMQLVDGHFMEVSSWLFANVGVYRSGAGTQVRSAT